MIVILSILGLFGGLFTGILTGLTPGIHVNVMAALMVAFYSTSSGNNNLTLAISIFIVSVSVAHAFFDYIPSLFLGVPGDEVYALLPGQKLIKNGEGGEALKLSLEGSWRGLFFALIIALGLILFSFLGFDILIQIEGAIKPLLFWILLSTSLVLIFSERRKIWAISIFLLSGFFGIVTLGTPLVPGTSSAFNVLFPALSGLFGISGLILSLFDETGKLPPQKSEISLKISNSSINRSSLMGTLSGMAVGLLPGLGAANAATLLLLLTGNEKDENNDRLYIVTTSAIQASDTLFGITALYFIEKSRSGASVAIQSVLGEINPWQVLIIILVMGFVGFLSRWIILSTWQFFIKAINFFNYRSLTIAVIVFITLLVLLTTGFWGLMVLVAATSLGVLPPTIGVRRSQMMGFFLIPVMLFFSGLQEPIVNILHLQAKISPAPTVSINQIIQSLIISFSTALIAYFIGMCRISKKQK